MSSFTIKLNLDEITNIIALLKSTGGIMGRKREFDKLAANIREQAGIL